MRYISFIITLAILFILAKGILKNELDYRLKKIIQIYERNLNNE